MKKFLAIFFSTLISYLFIFFYFFLFLNNSFEKNFKIKETAIFYKKYFNQVEHIRYKDKYRFEKKSEDLIFNYIKKKPGDKTILFQGDSWMNHINKYQSSQKLIKDQLNHYPNIINAGTTSYSPSLMFSQFKILENDFNILPSSIIIYVDQTDMGDELCRYKRLINYDAQGNFIKVSGEKFPLYQDVFNLHEKIELSLIQLNDTNRFIKTQLLINYKIEKSMSKIIKKIISFLYKDKEIVKCEWQIIERYKEKLSKKDEKYLVELFKKYFSFLNKKNFIETVYVVTHPHKKQLLTNEQPIDVSRIVSKSIIRLNKFEHINFSNILKKEKIYENLETIWKNDQVHLKERDYNIFLKKLLEFVE